MGTSESVLGGDRVLDTPRAEWAPASLSPAGLQWTAGSFRCSYAFALVTDATPQPCLCFSSEMDLVVTWKEHLMNLVK